MIASNHFINDIANSGEAPSANHPHVYDLERIAYALNNLQRYQGNYPMANTVAQHSLRVASYVRRATAEPIAIAVALLHDAHESVIGDLPYAIKRVPVVRDIDDLARDEFLRTIVGGNIPVWVMDLIALADEHDAVNEFSAAGWLWPADVARIPDENAGQIIVQWHGDWLQTAREALATLSEVRDV
jgi:hypothetical protein